MRRPLDSENDSDRSSDEEHEPIVFDHPLPVITLTQYRASLKVNALLYLLLEHSGKLKSAFKPVLALSLVLNVILYFRPASRLNAPTISVERWLLTPLSWLTQILILLQSENEYYLSGQNELLSKHSILYFIFFVQMIYYLMAFAP